MIQNNPGVRKALFLASAVRCGSTYVAEEIAYRLQRAAELQFFDLTKDAFFGLTESSTASEIKQIYGSLFLDTSGWATSKIHCAGLSIVTREARLDSALSDAFFGPNARWLVVQRRDKIAQAVSLAMARKTGAWHVYESPDSSPDSTAEVTTTEINEALRAILMDDIYLEAFSRNLAPDRVINVVYEDVVQGARRATTAVIALCGLDVRLPRDKERKVAKVVPTATDLKVAFAQRFAAWFAENYHETGNLDRQGSSSALASRSPAFKARVALEALSGERQIAQLAAQHGVDSRLIIGWKDELRRRAIEIFAEPGNAVETDDSRPERKNRRAGRTGAGMDPGADA